MARPNDWWVLERDGDPTPGVVESVQALARQFHGFADDTESAWRNLNSFGSDVTALSWVGQSADAFKDNFGPLPGRLQKLYTSYREAGDALDAYWPRLQAAQTKADNALRDGRDAHADVQRATSTADTAAANLKTAQQQQQNGAATTDPNALADAQHAHDTAQSHLTEATGRLQAAKHAADDAYNDRIAAAKDCAKALHHASSDGIHNKSWWDHVGEALSEIGGEIAEIAGELAPILDVIALATSWIPGVDVVTAALAETANIIALVGTVMKIAGDGMQGHWGDALMGVGMLGLQFAGGRLLGRLGGEARGAENAATSGERSAGNEARAADGNGPAFCKDDPVDVVSGQMLTSKTDLALPGTLPVVLRRAYASGYATGRLFGPGWSSTLDQRVAVNAAGIHLAGDDAQTLTFPIPAAGEEVLATRGPRWTLVWDREADEIRVTDPETGQTRHFPTVHHGEDAGQIRDLTAITDRNGNRISILRTDDGTPTAVEHPAYRVAVDTAVTAAGPRVTGLRLLDGTEQGVTVTTFEYDDRGRLNGVTDASSVPFRYEHDAADRITAWIDQLGYRYGYEYDDAGRVVRTLGAGGYLSGTFLYDEPARTTTHRDSLGQVTVFRYDDLGHVIAITDPLGAVSGYLWDRHGDLLSFTDEVSGTTVYTVDERGDTVRTLRADGAVTVVAYNDLHQPTRITGPDGGLWQYEYDERGNLTATTDPVGARTRYSYAADGSLVEVVNALGETTRYAADAAGLPTATTDDTGATWTVGYDAFGRPVTTTDPLGASTVSTWSVDGNPLTRTHPDASVGSWRWDARGNLVALTDEAGNTTRYEYGPFQAITARVDADGTRYTFEHDSELRVVAVTDPAGAVWSYEYDPVGNLVGERDFDGRRLAYGYDPAGRLIRRVNGAGESVELVRDLLGRVVEQRADGRTAMTAEYDAAGALSVARNGEDEIVLMRDARGLLVGESVNGRAVRWTVDAVGRRRSRTTPSGRVSDWDYDAAGRPSALAVGTGGMTFAHDAAGREITRRIGGHAAITSDWDRLGRLTRRRVVTAADSAQGSGLRVRHERTWSYRADGTPLAVADTALGGQRIDLDRLGRVTAVHAATWRETFAYDAAGNLAHSSDSRTPDSATAGERAFAGTRLRQAGRTSYDYDAQGRLIRRVRRTLSGGRRIWSYRYDAFDRLVEAVLPDGERWRYGYDGLGRRLRKQRVDESGAPLEVIEFAWDGTVLAEQTHSVRDRAEVTTTTWDYEPDGWAPVAQERRVYSADTPQDVIDVRFHAIVTDLVGAPTELVTPDGEVAWRSAQTLWGAPVPGGGGGGGSGRPGGPGGDGISCPLRFPGQYRDEETGLDYNYVRYYDPENGRYITADPLGLTPAPNHYAYVDNPHTWTDPFGLAKGKGGGNAASGPPPWASDELARIKAGNGIPRTVSTTDPTQQVWTGNRNGVPDAYKRKWGAQPEVPPRADGTGGRPAYPGTPEWEVAGKPDRFRIVGPNQYGEYGYTDNHYDKITAFPKCTP